MAEWSEAELEERNRIIRRMMGARTLAEAREAKSAVRAWRAQHPEDDAILSGGEVLSHATDFAELRDAERRALGFRDETGLERERVFVQAERAFTLDEIVHARRELLAWRWKYVCDEVIIKEMLGYLDEKEMLEWVLSQELLRLETDSITVSKNGAYNGSYPEGVSQPALTPVSAN